MSDRIQGLIDAGRLSREPAPDDEVAGLWANALQAYTDATFPHLSANGRLVRAYDAGRIAASALVRANDLRVRAANHHEMTIGVAALLGSEELRAALRRFEAFRSLRSNIEYGWQAQASDDDVNRAVDVVRSILEHGARELHPLRPAISSRITPPS
jgi:hypothetical protein